MLALVACGTPAVAPAPPSNRSAQVAKPQAFKTLVIEEYSDCSKQHHVVVSIDDVVRATIVVACLPPPVPHGNVIVTSSDPHLIDGPAFEVGPGDHVLVVKDLETGLVARQEGTFPVHGSLTDPKPKEPLADTLVVIVHIDWIRADVDQRARLIFL